MGSPGVSMLVRRRSSNFQASCTASQKPDPPSRAEEPDKNFGDWNADPLDAYDQWQGCTKWGVWGWCNILCSTHKILGL